MEFKVLKHKALEDTFGVLLAGDNTEVWQSSTPQLLQMSVTIENLKDSNKRYLAYKQLDDYDLVIAELKIEN